MNMSGGQSGAAWSYSAYHATSAPDDFGPLGPMVALWRSKWTASGSFPAWRDFDFHDFAGWWGQLSLGELQRDPFDLRWVLWGTKLVEWWGKEYTNQRISQQPYLGEQWEKNELPYLRSLRDKRLIGFVSGSLSPQDRDFSFVHGVDLPLEQDGEVSHIFSVYSLREPQDDFAPAPPPVFVF